MRRCEHVRAQLYAAGLVPFITDTDLSNEAVVRGRIKLTALNVLRADPRFVEGGFHLLHADVGKPRTEFRSHRGEVGDGSLQIVVNKRTGDFYSDLDGWSPYSDVVGAVAHLGGEVIWPKVRRFFTRRKTP